MVYCFVLAGNIEIGDLDECFGTSTGKLAHERGKRDNHYNQNKALIPINGRPMISYIVRALEESRYIEQVFLVGPKKLMAEVLPQYRDSVIDTTGSDKVVDNLLQAIEKTSPPGNVLVVTSDIPLITAQAIDDFLDQCHPDYDLVYPVISKDVTEKRFSEVERTYFPFADGRFTGGNVFYFKPEKLPPRYNQIHRLIMHRKNPLLLAMNFGIIFLIQFVSGRLTLKEAETKISRVLQIKAKVVITEYPELGIDIDKASDLELAKKIILQHEIL